MDLIRGVHASTKRTGAAVRIFLRHRAGPTAARSGRGGIGGVCRLQVLEEHECPL